MLYKQYIMYIYLYTCLKFIFTYMSTEKVRIIDKKGEHRFVMPHIAKDKTLMKSYGYRIEDLNIKEDAGVKPVAMESLPDEKLNDDLGFEDLISIQEQPVKGKPGRKPNLKK